MHAAILAYRVIEGGPVLGNEILGNRVVPVKPRQQIIEARRVNLPAHSRKFRVFGTYLLDTPGNATQSLAYESAEVVIDAQEIQTGCNDPGIGRLGFRCYPANEREQV